MRRILFAWVWGVVVAGGAVARAAPDPSQAQAAEEKALRPPWVAAGLDVARSIEAKQLILTEAERDRQRSEAAFAANGRASAGSGGSRRTLWRLIMMTDINGLVELLGPFREALEAVDDGRARRTLALFEAVLPYFRDKNLDAAVRSSSPSSPSSGEPR